MAGDRYSENSKKPKYAVIWREDLAAPEVLALKPAAFRCWVTLRAHIFTDEGYRVCHELLHDFTGYDRRTVQRALAELIEAGLLDKRYRTKNGSTKQDGNHWTLNEPPSVGAARGNGDVPQQYPQGRHGHRPEWRSDRRHEASTAPPLEGGTDAAQQGQNAASGEISIVEGRPPVENATRTGRWPGLLAKVSDEITRRTLRTMSRWALAQRAPTRADVKRRLEAAIRETSSEEYKEQVIAYILNSGIYDMNTQGRSFPGFRHAIKSGWTRATRKGVQRASDLIIPRINLVKARDSKGLIRELRALRMDVP